MQNNTLHSQWLLLNIKLLFGAILIYTSCVLSYPKISSAEWCQPKHCKTTVDYCAIKSDSLKESEISFNAKFLKNQSVFNGTIKPDKKGLKYRTLKPESTDPQMVRIPDSEIQMR